MSNFAPKEEAQKKASAQKPKETKTKIVSLPDKPNRTDSQGRKQGEWGKKYPNGRFRYVATFKDGKPVGKVKRYYPNGHFSSIITYDSDSDTCRVETYHSDGGKVECSGKYVNQRREGEWRFFREDGSLVESATYAGGKLHGIQALYYEDGRLLSITTWVDSLRQGPMIKYFPSGAKMAEGAYDVDDLDGKYTTWGSDGKITEQGQYAHGIKVGKWHVRVPDDGVEYDIVYNRYGLIENRAEVDSIQSMIIERHEALKGTFDDPADYVENPEQYIPFK